MIRRSVTIDDENYTHINKFRSYLLSENIDLDFTSTINFFLALASYYLGKEGTFPPHEFKILLNYVGNDELQLASAEDEHLAILIRKNLPKIMKSSDHKYLPMHKGEKVASQKG